MREAAYKLSIASIIIVLITTILIIIIFSILEKYANIKIDPWIKYLVIFLNILPLGLMIPMTITTKKTIGDGKDHICLAIFHMLFMAPFGLISGILLLLPEEKSKNEKKDEDEININK